jgi:GT2 family glycosyltransferase
MLYIIIPVFNRKEHTRKCLESLYCQIFREFKIIIVDDGSTDGTKEMLKNNFPEVSVIFGDGNLWWTASVNRGIELALRNNAEYIMTLNNDTIAPFDFLEKMMMAVKQQPDTLIGAFAIENLTNKPVYGGGKINWITASITLLLDELPEKERYGLHEVDHFPGRGLMIPKSVFEKIGLFNERRLPHYFADYDFTYQAFKNGFRIYCNYDARLITFPDESGDRQNRHRKSLQKYYNHLFGIKGGGNLKNFTHFAWRNCPKKYLPTFLVIGYLKRIFGYLYK